MSSYGFRHVASLLLTLALLIVTSVVLFACVNYLANVGISSGVTALYVFVLCGTFYFSRKNMAPVGSLLFTAGIVLALVVNARTSPVTAHSVNGWLKQEVKSGVGTPAVMAFIAKHQATKHTIHTFKAGTEIYIVVTYLNDNQIFNCFPDPRIIFEFDRTNHLVSYQVDEQPTCS